MSTKSNIGAIKLSVSMQVKGFHLAIEKQDEIKKYSRSEERRIDDFNFNAGFEVEDVTLEASKEAIEATFNGLKSTLESLETNNDNKILTAPKKEVKEKELDNIVKILKAPRGTYNRGQVKEAKRKMLEMIEEKDI